MMKDRILSELEKADGYVSGEQLSKLLGVSRTAVWKNIKQLKEDGCKINSVTNKGYMLCEKPDLLDAGKISSRLCTSVVGTKIEVLKVVDSTNEEVKRRAAVGAASGLLIAADRQTGGKGRLGRVWESDTGGVYFTLLLRPDLPPNDISGVTLAMGYGVCTAIRKYTDLDAKIKWPNDIIIGNKKVCGILTEMAAQTDRVDYIAVGIGINVNHSSFPDEISHKATSLYIETGHKIDRNEFLACVISELDKAAARFIVGFTKEETDYFKSLCATLGRNVKAVKNGKEIEGIATDVLYGGELQIRLESGEYVSINSGEVVVQGIY